MLTETPIIRRRREALGLSQEAIARMANCSTGFLRHLEAGYRPQTESRTLARIEDALTAAEIKGAA